jgi:hypothetical protein
MVDLSHGGEERHHAGGGEGGGRPRMMKGCSGVEERVLGAPRSSHRRLLRMG